MPPGNLLGREGAGIEALERCRERAIAAQCAEAIGAMTELNKATLEYTKTRKQFGVPLSSFQVLQLQQPVDAGVFEHTLGISQRHDSLRHRPGKCNCPSWSDWRSSECSKGV